LPLLLQPFHPENSTSQSTLDCVSSAAHHDEHLFARFTQFVSRSCHHLVRAINYPRSYLRAVTHYRQPVPPQTASLLFLRSSRLQCCDRTLSDGYLLICADLPVCRSIAAYFHRSGNDCRYISFVRLVDRHALALSIV
jgi:hypothetical protein